MKRKGILGDLKDDGMYYGKVRGEDSMFEDGGSWMKKKRSERVEDVCGNQGYRMKNGRYGIKGHIMIPESCNDHKIKNYEPKRNKKEN